MSAAVMSFSAEFRCGLRAELRLRMPEAGAALTCMDCEWTPRPPDLSGRRGRQILASYRVWRNDCISKFAQAHGLEFRLIGGLPDAIALVKPGVRQ
jgi:hypothetical protein